MNPASQQPSAGPSWRQTHIEFDDDRHAERTGITYLGPTMNDAERAGTVASWFFTRKASQWRLRYLPTQHDTDHEAHTRIQRALDTLRTTGEITGWAETIYEPEVHAFGGTTAMDLAHQLFHHDSRHILTYLGSDIAAGQGDKRRELSILLAATLMRSARQDWYEQGDIWARLADNRPLTTATGPDQTRRIQQDLHRLLTVDASPTSPLTQPEGTLAYLADWTSAFHQAGTALGNLARNGTLERGVRAVLTHHLLFHWNRIGLNYQTQALLAHAAQAVILGE